MRIVTVDYSSYRDKAIEEARENRAHEAANRPQTLSDDYLYLRYCPWPTDALESMLEAENKLTAIVGLVFGALLALIL